MNIVFALRGSDGAEYGEDQAGLFALQGKLPCKSGDFDGLLRLQHEGQSELVLRDDLHDLVPSLCVEAVAACLRDGSSQFALSTVFQPYRLTLQGGQVLLEDARQPPVQPPRLYPQAAFTQQALACAQRFERFLSTLVDKDTQWQGALDRLRAGLPEE